MSRSHTEANVGIDKRRHMAFGLYDHKEVSRRGKKSVLV